MNNEVNKEKILELDDQDDLDRMRLHPFDFNFAQIKDHRLVYEVEDERKRRDQFQPIPLLGEDGEPIKIAGGFGNELKVGGASHAEAAAANLRPLA